MNYLAHLFLAQPTADSCFGNLLGDFRRGVDLQNYTDAVRAGVTNHIFVDKFTDTHHAVRQARQLVSAPRRRFAGVMLDVLFDHFLLKHWSSFSGQSFSDFSQTVYHCLAQRYAIMPWGMQPMIKSMLEHRWLDTYSELNGVERALERTAARIRFDHEFYGSIEDIYARYERFEEVFVSFFPDLMLAVKQQQIERLPRAILGR